MGLFSGIGKAFKGIDWDRVSAGLGAAGATVHGDYGNAAQIWGQYHRNRKDAAQEAQEAQQRQQLIAAAVQAGVPAEQAQSLPSSALASIVSKQYEKPARNDTVEDFNWYKGLSEEDRRVYDQMHPIYRTGPDGLPYPMARDSLGGPKPAPPGVTFTPLGDGGAAPGQRTFPSQRFNDAFRNFR